MKFLKSQKNMKDDFHQYYLEGIANYIKEFKPESISHTITTTGLNTTSVASGQVTTTSNVFFNGLNWIPGTGGGNINTFISRPDEFTLTDYPYVTTDFTYHQNPTFNFFPRFLCYPTSEDRISDGKKEIIFKLFSQTKLEYDSLLKHLGMEKILFNTLLMEYALQQRLKFFMQLFSRNSQFTPEELYGEIVGKIYE